MATYKIDPDVERWGLHLLDVCTLANDTSRCAVTGYDADFSNVEYVSEGYVRPRCSVENDEVIAHAYQEELSRLASAEAASGRRDFGDENLQASSILAQDWFGLSKRHESGNGWKTESDRDGKGTLGDIGNKEVTTMKGCGEQSVGEVEDCGTRINGNADTQVGSGYTYCIPGDNTGNIMIHGQDLDYVLEVTDESSLDSEVGRRLNDMVPVPHVPKTVEKIPSADEEISDHERLLERLQLYELIERKVQGDGNCQFRALSDQLYRSAEHHSFVREQIVQQLKGHPEMYAGYVPMAYADYLKKMNKSGEWGDHVTLQAAADWYGVKIFVITSFKDTCSIEILPHLLKSNRVIFLSFWAEVHYNSIYPEGELPEPCMKKKKKWWNIIS